MAHPSRVTAAPRCGLWPTSTTAARPMRGSRSKRPKPPKSACSLSYTGCRISDEIFKTYGSNVEALGHHHQDVEHPKLRTAAACCIRPRTSISQKPRNAGEYSDDL